MNTTIVEFRNDLEKTLREIRKVINEWNSLLVEESLTERENNELQNLINKEVNLEMILEIIEEYKKTGKIKC